MECNRENIHKKGFIDFEFYNQYGRGGSNPQVPVILRNWVDLI